MRPLNSSYDRMFAKSTEELLQALISAGHKVETPVTGSVIVDGVLIPRNEWDRWSVDWDGDLEWVEEQIEWKRESNNE